MLLMVFETGSDVLLNHFSKESTNHQARTNSNRQLRVNPIPFPRLTANHNPFTFDVSDNLFKRAKQVLRYSFAY